MLGCDAWWRVMMMRVEELWSRVRDKIINVIGEAFRRAFNDVRQLTDAIIILFSAGKDSSLILAALYDPQLDYPHVLAVDTAHLSRFIVTHIVVTGNSHPANTYCAASVALAATEDNVAETEMLSAFLASSEVFQALAAKYGLQIGPRRWCWLRFKYNVLYNWLVEQFPDSSGHVVLVDGMSPDDRPQRRHIVRDAVEEVELSSGYRFIAAHPLYDIELDAGEKLELLRWLAERGERAYRELGCGARSMEPMECVTARIWRNMRCVVELYETYGDSMNCVLCPYKSPRRLLRNVAIDPALREALALFIETALRSEKWKQYARTLRTKTLTEFYM